MPPSEEYHNFMGRVQGGKIRSQSAINIHKREAKQPVQTADPDVIEIPLGSFDKKMSQGSISKFYSVIW